MHAYTINTCSSLPNVFNLKTNSIRIKLIYSFSHNQHNHHIENCFRLEKPWKSLRVHVNYSTTSTGGTGMTARKDQSGQLEILIDCSGKVYRIGTLRCNWPMSVNASQAFSTSTVPIRKI